MKQILSIAAIVLLNCVAVYAQTELPGKVKAFCPQVLLQAILKETEAEALMKSGDFGQHQKNTSKYWYAYSDRADNTTYASPSPSSARFSALKFNEEVRIAEIKNGYAHVYTEPMKSIDYPKVSSVAQSRGWVPMKNLLLWNACPTNEKGIYNKALLCMNLDNANGGNSSDMGNGYYIPNESTSWNFTLTTDMNFYFIMKRENDMALLASQSKMDGQFSSQVLFCWVPSKSYVPWNQRSCLEPTWEHEDVEYFVDKNIAIDIYKSRTLKESRVSQLKFTKKKSENYNQFLYRMAGDKLRYPILDEGTTTVYNMSTFGTVGGTADIHDDVEVKRQKIEKEVLEKLRNINLAIVIDGTSSMEPYYPAVKEAIKEGCKAFASDAKIKVGVVIYRDYDDGEDGLVEVLPMRSARNLSILNSFLDTGGKYGIRSSRNDRTLTEAMFCGINTALDRLDFVNGESNIMLVIGDCGNDPNDSKAPGQDVILKKLVDKDISLMGFQVKNSNVVAYNHFTNQITSLMRKSLQENYRKHNDKITVTVETKKHGDGYDYMGKGTDIQRYIVSYRFADPTENNGQMDPNKLSSHMVEGISVFSQAIQKHLDLMVKGLMSGLSTKSEIRGFGPGNAEQGGMNFSTALFESTLGTEWKKLVKPNDLISFRGFSSKQRDDRNFFKPVIFISGEEFDDLLKRMAPVDQAASISNASDRTPYIEAMKALVRSFAPGMTDAEMAKLNNAQITAMIGGLNEASEGLAKYKLDDLSNGSIITNPEYLKIIRDFARKYKNLKNIRSSKKYEFIKEFNGSRYYWIPIEDLP